MDCRHYFYGDIKFGNGKIKSMLNFDDNVGVAWGGNTGLRYWSNNATYGAGLYLGITANSRNTYVVGNSITMRCDTWVQNHSLYIRKGYLDIDDGCGICCTGTIAFRWVNGNGLFVGMDAYNLKLVGSNIYANGSPRCRNVRRPKKYRSTFRTIFKCYKKYNACIVQLYKRYSVKRQDTQASRHKTCLKL